MNVADYFLRSVEVGVTADSLVGRTVALITDGSSETVNDSI